MLLILANFVDKQAPILDKTDFNTPWRKVASTIYKKPVDSKIFGQIDIDITELEQFISSQRKTGIKVTYTHIFTLILARCIRYKVPELNCYVRRGKIIARKNIDAMVSVLQANGGMSSVKVPNADTLLLHELITFLQNEISTSRKGAESGAMDKKNDLLALPWPLRGWFFSIFRFITLHLGLTLPFLKLTPESFGSYVVSNIGTLGLDTGYPALLPASNVASVLVLGGIQDKPTVVHGEIVIRKFISISMVLDHRIVDASHGGKVARYLKEMVRKPEELLKPPLT